MANDYSALQDQMANDLSAAATSAALNGGSGQKRQIQIRKSEMGSAIPDGSKVWIEAVPMSKLVMGDLIIVTLGQGPQIRRFLRIKMTGSDTVLEATHEGSSAKESLSKATLLGRVVSAEAGGKKWDPNKQNPIQRFWGNLTEYGTHKPFGFG